MKKILFSLLLLIGTSAYAQKSYVTVYTYDTNSAGGSATISGDIPSYMKSQYDGRDFGSDVYSNSKYWIGALLNLLASEGFTVEQIDSFSPSTTSTNTYSYNRNREVIFLLSKPSNGTNPANAIEKIETKNDEKVTEVARYNLQGLPVQSDEKGIQIIVYSNFTTKTVVIQ